MLMVPIVSNSCGRLVRSRSPWRLGTDPSIRFYPLNELFVPPQLTGAVCGVPRTSLVGGFARSTPYMEECSASALMVGLHSASSRPFWVGLQDGCRDCGSPTEVEIVGARALHTQAHLAAGTPLEPVATNHAKSAGRGRALKGARVYSCVS